MVLVPDIQKDADAYCSVMVWSLETVSTQHFREAGENHQKIKSSMHTVIFDKSRASATKDAYWKELSDPFLYAGRRIFQLFMLKKELSDQLKCSDNNFML